MEKFYMNDLTSMLDAGCTILIKLAVACALLALANLLRAWAKPKQETLVWANSNGVSTGSTGTALQVVMNQPEAQLQPPTVQEPEPEIRPSIVCGNCKNEIKSPPVADEQGATIYRCETCGMRVKAPLAP